MVPATICSANRLKYISIMVKLNQKHATFFKTFDMENIDIYKVFEFIITFFANAQG
jgi:hypothetical protein